MTQPQPQLPPSSQEQEEKLYSMAQAVRACGLPANFRCRQLPAILKAFEHCPTPLRIEGDRDWRYTEFAIGVFSEFAGFRKLGRSGEWLKRKAAEYAELAQPTAQDLQPIAPQSAQQCAEIVQGEIVEVDPTYSIGLLQQLELRQVGDLTNADTKLLQINQTTQQMLNEVARYAEQARIRTAELKRQEREVRLARVEAEEVEELVESMLIRQRVQSMGK